MDTNGGNNKMESSNALDFNQMDSFFDNMFNNTPVQEEKQEEITKEEEQKLTDNKVENISNVNADNAIKKLSAIRDELNNEFVERSELIDIMILAVITSSNLLMLGPPGTAKSQISRAMCNRIDNSNYFEWLLNKSSDPAELLGTYSIKGMENDEFKRMTAGKLPEAHIAFIDEVYKCNSPTLNALLSIMNEHIFYNNGKVVPVPLISMFAASNEPPEDESLLAMHDRFLFRTEVEYLHDAASKKKMFNNYIYDRAGLSNNIQKTTITPDELEILQDKAKHISVSKNIINKLISLMNSLQKNSTISVSDRRANECIKVLQGSALVHGRTKVGLDDFNALKYVLWTKKEDIDAISAEIAKIVNPFDESFDKYKRQFHEVRDRIDSNQDVKMRNQAYFQYQNSLKSILNRVNKLVTEAASNGKDTTEFVTLRQTITDYYTNLTNEVLGGIAPNNDKTILVNEVLGDSSDDVQDGQSVLDGNDNSSDDDESLDF